MYTIYTKSSCTYCVKVKDLLKEKGYSYSEINCDSDLETPEKKEAFLKMIKEMTNMDYKTFPMIFRDDVFIGGFTQTIELILKEEDEQKEKEKDSAFD
jgi:glutaredoxin